LRRKAGGELQECRVGRPGKKGKQKEIKKKGADLRKKKEGYFPTGYKGIRAGGRAKGR